MQNGQTDIVRSLTNELIGLKLLLALFVVGILLGTGCQSSYDIHPDYEDFVNDPTTGRTTGFPIPIRDGQVLFLRKGADGSPVAALKLDKQRLGPRPRCEFSWFYWKDASAFEANQLPEKQHQGREVLMPTPGDPSTFRIEFESFSIRWAPRSDGWGWLHHMMPGEVPVWDQPPLPTGRMLWICATKYTELRTAALSPSSAKRGVYYCQWVW